MKFTLNINMDNAAFSEYPEDELKRLLEEIAPRAGNGKLEDTVFDINGNNVGSWDIEL